MPATGPTWGCRGLIMALHTAREDDMVNELHLGGGHAGADSTMQNHGCLTGVARGASNT
jgi:hypothetical protein